MTKIPHKRCRSATSSAKSEKKRKGAKSEVNKGGSASGVRERGRAAEVKALVESEAERAAAADPIPFPAARAPLCLAKWTKWLQ